MDEKEIKKEIMKNEALQKTLINGLMHGLKLYYEDSDKTCTMVGVDYREHETYPTRITVEWMDSEHIWMFKPYLRDISDLTKDEHKHIYSDFNVLVLPTSFEDIQQYSYELVERLIKHRFNVFDLKPDEYIKVTEENNPYKIK